MVATSRRRLLLAAATIPLAVAVMRIGDAYQAAGEALRPLPAGTSGTRCAACGAYDHAMLDPGCPETPRVRVGARA
jgi:hypothetical protein